MLNDEPDTATEATPGPEIPLGPMQFLYPELRASLWAIGYCVAIPVPGLFEPRLTDAP